MSEVENGSEPESPEVKKPLELTFRAASADELKELPRNLRLHPAVLIEWAEAIASGKMKMILACSGDVPVGRVNLYYQGPKEQAVVQELGGTVVWMEGMFTAEDWLRRGVGEALTREFEREATTVSHLAGLAVDRENIPAVELYKKLGWRHRKVLGEDTFERQPFFEGDPPMQRWLMVKELKPVGEAI